MTERMPIETAPKDGRVVLLGWSNYVCQGRWADCTSLRNEKATTVYDWCTTEERLQFSEDPTHWMPLPDPPKTGYIRTNMTPSTTGG